MRKQSKYPYVVLVILIITSIGATFYKNLSYHYEMQGEVTQWLDYNMAVHCYDVVSATDETDKRFAVTGEDPQLILTFGAMQTVGGIRLELNEAWKGEQPLPVQVFYAKMGENFTERHSVQSALKSGEDTLLIPIEQGQYQIFRFDIDGDFGLAGIQSCDRPMAAQAYVSKETINICVWYFPAIILGFSSIFWAHRVCIRQGKWTVKSYIKNIFLGAKPTLGHEVYLDYLRVLAAVFVILAHACSPMVDLADANWKRFVLVCGLSLGLCCNLLYVMLSGTLLLGVRKNMSEDVIVFYIKRASKVIIPLIAYYLLLLRLGNEVHFLPPQSIGISLKRIISGAPDVGPHLWLIYTIVALYFVTPFLRVMVLHMSDKLLFSMVAVIVVLNMLTTYLPLFDMTFGATVFLASWEGVFLLGYFLTRQNEISGAKKRNRMMMFAAVVSYIVMVAVVYADSAQMNYVYGCSTTMIITSCGIFVLFMNNKEKLKGKSNAFIRICSKYSYSIILIHWYALFVVVEGKFHITALRFGCLGGIAASVVVTFVVCIAMAFVFDNTVVIVCKVLFDKLTARVLNTRSAA